MVFTTLCDAFSLLRPQHVTTHNNVGPIITLSFSPNGRFLAGGGADGIKVWDVKRMVEVKILQSSEIGQVTSICWATRKEDSVDTLCYGNALGFLNFLQYRPTDSRFEAVYSCRIANGGPILCVSAITASEWIPITTCTQDRWVQAWFYHSFYCELVLVHSKRVAEAIGWCPVHSGSFAFEPFGGRKPGRNAAGLTHIQIASRIGDPAVSWENRLCIMNNASGGFDLYSTDTGTRLKTFYAYSQKTYPRPIGAVFAAQSRAIVGGSDHGCVYIFGRQTGKVVKTLRHSWKGGVEVIAAHDTNEGTVLIATASSTNLGPIRLWKWVPPQAFDFEGRRATVDAVMLLALIGVAYVYFRGLLV